MVLFHFFCLLLHIPSAVFGTEPKHGKCKYMHCWCTVFFLFCFCHNGSKQGKEAWKCIYIAFAILGETEGLFSEWMRLKDLRGKLPAAKAVCGQIKTLVIAGNLLLWVTHNPVWSRQEAAAEYFLFLPPCRRQTGATFLNQRRLGVED